MKSLFAAAVVATCIGSASAVTLGPNGLGQALIYPYYTVQSAGGSAFNTYLSVTNHASDAKAVRVRFREGRMGRETLAFNVFLPRGDTWTAAVVPNGDGARLITRDASCTDPAFTASGDIAVADFRTATFAGVNADGAGEGLDRTREGYVEMLEMGTLDTSELSFTDCASLRGRTPRTVTRPTGGLGGTLTLLNVATGLVFTLEPHALAELASRAYFRLPSDPYPDFSAAEVDPISVVVHRESVYRSVWPRPQDAVSAVFMTTRLSGDFVLDRGTASTTDVIALQPTRRLYANDVPFSQAQRWSADCGRSELNGETLRIAWADRDAREAVLNNEVLCATAGVASVRRSASAAPPPSDVLGSRTLGLARGEIVLPATAENGRIDLLPSSGAAAQGMVSLPESTRLAIATGQVTAGSHRHYGLPLLGATFYVYRNAALLCGTQLCQGSYGNAFRMRSESLVELRPN